MDQSPSGSSRWALVVGLVIGIGSGIAGAADLRGSTDAGATTRTDTGRLSVITLAPGAAADVRGAIAHGGGRVLAHLGTGRWLVTAGGIGLVDLTGVVSHAPWRPSDGVAPELRAAAEHASSRPAATLGVILGLAPGADLPVVEARLGGAGATVAWVEPDASPVPQIGLRVPAALLSDVIAELDETNGLAWAGLQPRVRLLNDDSVWRCQSGEPARTPVFDRGLRGEEQIIGVIDTGIDIDDCRFDDPDVGLPAINDATGVEVDPRHRKVVAVNFHWDGDWPPGSRSWDDHGHGTHVAGSAAGDESGNRLHDGYDGMAPAAKLVIQDGGISFDDCADLPGLGCPVKPLEPVLAQARVQGARIHSNSWGDEENIWPYGRYTERTADVDRFVWNHRDAVVVFAAGNWGPGVATVISPSTGKNVISVGAALHGDFEPTCVAAFSSRGWTRDGRVKPDVVAPGAQVASAASNGFVPAPSCDARQSTGTSMAAPTVAGLAALVRQYFIDGFHPTGRARPADGFEPSAALVKAVLIASAVDLGARGCLDEPIPSRDQGWGLVQLDTALSFTGSDRRLVADDRGGGFSSSTDEPVRVPIAAMRRGPLKVVLVWTDAPSSSLATANLVNDLDLTVTGPGGSFRGNALIDGESAIGGAPDRINNVEVVWLPEAERGLWTVEVAPHVVSAPPQDFALVVTGPVRRDSGPRRGGDRVAP